MIKIGSPGRTRTSDIEINSFALLPTELLGNKSGGPTGSQTQIPRVQGESNARYTISPLKINQDNL